MHRCAICLAHGWELQGPHGSSRRPTNSAAYSNKPDGITGVEIAQADVLQLNGLPGSWRNYDLIVSASMLEYIPPDRLVAALRGIRGLLHRDGRFILFITRRTWLMRLLIGRWWQSNLYNAPELEEAFRRAGFANVAFGAFPPLFRHLAHWGHIVEARA